ncbi:YvcK family protein [Candidatus Woesearchaeota archaeon]|nr:YvcK family protein [Candidatus Woesearchaeota archaeon]
MKKNILVFGGGTGSSTLLKGLEKLDDVQITAVVAAFDDGGSGGKLRQQLHVLPPGDPRVCLAATSPHEEILNYRFQEGDLRGHTIGNIIIAGLEKIKGNLSDALSEATKLFQSPITILPVTEDQAHLFVVLEEGSIVKGEDTVSNFPPLGELSNKKVVKVELTPKPRANPKVLEAIKKADLIVIAPGNLYASCLSHFLTLGIPEALQKSKAKKIYITNLFTKWGHLQFTSKDFVESIQQFCFLDYVLVNDAKPSKKMIDHYAKNNQYFVEDTTKDTKKPVIIRDNFVHDTQWKQDTADTVRRESIRHRYDKVSEHIKELL